MICKCNLYLCFCSIKTPNFLTSKVQQTWTDLWFCLHNYQLFLTLALKLAWELVTYSPCSAALPSSISSLSVFSFLFFTLLLSWCPAFKPVLIGLFRSTSFYIKWGGSCFLFNKNITLMMCPPLLPLKLGCKLENGRGSFWALTTLLPSCFSIPSQLAFILI